MGDPSIKSKMRCNNKRSHYRVDRVNQKILNTVFDKSIIIHFIISAYLVDLILTQFFCFSESQ